VAKEAEAGILEAVGSLKRAFETIDKNGDGLLTEEELEDHGQGDILPPNPAKMIIEKVRTRKGLPIDKKIVVAAEQQRTLSKKK
jgi:Ca2+-binding EF-hand superfamily protein